MIARGVKAGLAVVMLGCFAAAAFAVMAGSKPPAKHASPPPAALLRTAFVFLQRGDVAAAREVYLYLAFNGSAEGARGVGDTYNPAVLRALSNANALPNEDQARFWYGQAIEMEKPQRPSVAARPANGAPVSWRTAGDAGGRPANKAWMPHSGTATQLP